MHVIGARLSTFLAKTIQSEGCYRQKDTRHNCCWHCKVHCGQCELAGLRKKRRREREKTRTSIRRGHVKRPAKKVVGFMDSSTEGDEEWKRKRIKSEREWPTTQSRKAIEHRPQGSGTTSEEGPAHGTPSYK